MKAIMNKCISSVKIKSRKIVQG